MNQYHIFILAILLSKNFDRKANFFYYFHCVLRLHLAKKLITNNFIICNEINNLKLFCKISKCYSFYIIYSIFIETPRYLYDQNCTTISTYNDLSSNFIICFTYNPLLLIKSSREFSISKIFHLI